MEADLNMEMEISCFLTLSKLLNIFVEYIMISTEPPAIATRWCLQKLKPNLHVQWSSLNGHFCCPGYHMLKVML